MSHLLLLDFFFPSTAGVGRRRFFWKDAISSLSFDTGSSFRYFLFLFTGWTGHTIARRMRLGFFFEFPVARTATIAVVTSVHSFFPFAFTAATFTTSGGYLFVFWHVTPFLFFIGD